MSLILRLEPGESIYLDDDPEDSNGQQQQQRQQQWTDASEQKHVAWQNARFFPPK